MISSVARTYAQALKESFDDTKTQFIFDQLKIIDKIVETDRLLKFFMHPGICTKEKQKVNNEIFKNLDENISKEMIAFVDFLIEHHRIDMLGDIMKAYQEIIDEENEVVRVEIMSRMEIKKGLMDKIVSFLEDEYQKKVVATLIISEDIIGGIIIKKDGYIIDDSLLNKLNKIKASVIYGE